MLLPINYVVIGVSYWNNLFTDKQAGKKDNFQVQNQDRYVLPQLKLPTGQLRAPSFSRYPRVHLDVL